MNFLKEINKTFHTCYVHKNCYKDNIDDEFDASSDEVIFLGYAFSNKGF